MVQTIQKRGSLSSQIGAGIGQGLSEQVPKEIERYRLGEGLKKLRENPNASPFDTAVQLFNLPGLSKDAAASLMPIFQQELLRRQGVSHPGTTPGQNENMPVRNTSQPGNINVRPGDSFSQNGDEEPTIADVPYKYREMTPEQLRERTNELFQNHPGLYPTAEAAGMQAQRENQANLARYQTGEKNFDDKVGKFLQTNEAGVFKDIPGEYLDRFRAKVGQDIENGKDPVKAAADRAKEVRDFARERNSFKDINFLEKRSGGFKKVLSGIYDTYKKNGMLDLYRDDLQNFHSLSNEHASNTAYPLSANEQKTFKTLSPSKVLAYGPQGIIREAPTKKDTSLFSELIDNLSKSDSIYSITKALRERGYDPSIFISELRNSVENGLELNPRQSGELNTWRPYRPSLADEWFDLFTGE